MITMQQKKLLVLEDDPHTITIWRHALSEIVPGFEVEVFQSITSLMSKYTDFQQVESAFAFFIVDIFLSGDDTGLHFINQLTSQAKNRIIISSSASSVDLQYYLQQNYGQLVVLSKPVRKKEIRRAIRQLDMPELRLEESTDATSQAPAPRQSRHKRSPVIMVTGCSSGIGMELGKLLIQNPYYKVVLTARKKSLEAVQQLFPRSDHLMVLPLDITSAAEIKDVVDTVISQWGAVDILVNNAGVCFRSSCEQMDEFSELLQMKTNYLGPMALTRAIVPLMRENGRGKIINVSSASGFFGMPTMSSYSASKHALEGASEALWYELNPFGINVSVVRPGFINSDGHTHVKVAPKAQLSADIGGPFSDFYSVMTPFIARLMQLSPQKSQDIAREILRLIQTKNPPLWTNATRDATLLLFFKRLFTEHLAHKIIYQVLHMAFGWGKYSNARHLKRERHNTAET